MRKKDKIKKSLVLFKTSDFLIVDTNNFQWYTINRKILTFFKN